MEVDLPILLCFMSNICDIPSYLHDGDEDEAMLAICHILNHRSHRENIPKIKGYVEQIIPSLSAMEFKSHFR